MIYSFHELFIFFWLTLVNSSRFFFFFAVWFLVASKKYCTEIHTPNDKNDQIKTKRYTFLTALCARSGMNLNRFRKNWYYICPNNFLLQSLFWTHIVLCVKYLFIFPQLSVFPNNSIRISPIKLETGILCQMNNFLWNNVFYVSPAVSLIDVTFFMTNLQSLPYQEILANFPIFGLELNDNSLCAINLGKVSFSLISNQSIKKVCGIITISTICKERGFIFYL